MPLASLGPVDLIDVGEVALEASQTRATLAARAFPDVVDLVSGVVYTTRDLVADSLPEQGDYSFKISGSPALAPMALEARRPERSTNLSVAGLPLTGQATVLPREDLSVTWKAQPGADFGLHRARLRRGRPPRARALFVSQRGPRPHLSRGVAQSIDANDVDPLGAPRSGGCPRARQR